MITEILFIITGYLLGSLLFCLYLAKIKNKDLRKRGTQNPGATNLFLISKPLGIIGGLLDMLKGTIPTYLAYSSNANEWIVYATGIAAVGGHIFPVYHHFKGGKGTATTIGVMIVIILLDKQLQYGYVFIMVLGVLKILSTKIIRSYKKRKI